MNNITIAGHEYARHLLSHKHVLLHSVNDAVLIHDPDDRYDTVKSIIAWARDTLFLEFYDIEEPLETHRHPTHEDITKALQWHQDKKTPIIVTCTAGISRSAATAFVLACNGSTPEEAAKVWNKRLHYPNRLIVKIGAEILGKPEMIEITEEFLAMRAKMRKIKGKPPIENL